jgi:hypothetical protein
MRTKITILSAAALAAGLLSSQAQVFSANIVGYVNKPMVPHFNACANPLDANISNSGTNVFPNTGLLDGSAVLTWNGLVFKVNIIDSTSPSGFTDTIGNPSTAPDLSPGTGFLFDNQAGITNFTFVGSVHGVLSTGSISNFLALAVPPNVVQHLVGSVTPVGGGLISSLQCSNTAAARDGDVVQIPNISLTGTLQAYTVRIFDSTSGTGFTDTIGNPQPEPQIPIASYFIYNGQSTSPAWVQNLP